MEQSQRTHRALTAGLSIGSGLVLSAAAYAATIPFPQVHAVVESAVVPFAAGTVIGVGIYAAGTGISLARARRADAEAAVADSHGEAFDSVLHHAHRVTPKGVPVIARAQDALSEAEAWAEIDELLSADSPVSCDPAKSKDIYQIALEEMAKTSHGAAAAQSQPQAAAAAQPQAQPQPQSAAAPARQATWNAAEYAAAAADPAGQTGVFMRAQQAQAYAQAQAAAQQGYTAAPAASVADTNVFMALAGQGIAAAPAAAQGAVPASAVPSPAVSASFAVPVAAHPVAAGLSGSIPVVTSAPVRTVASVPSPAPSMATPVAQPSAVYTAIVNPLYGVSVPVVPTAAAPTATAYVTPSVSASMPAMQPQVAAAPVAASEPEPVEEEREVVEVPMADYSGHEDMWAQALAILSEGDAPATAGVVTAEATDEAEVEDETLFSEQARHEEDVLAALKSLDDTDSVDPIHMEAMAEGAEATSRFARVNEMLEEELEKVPSQSMRASSREYLRVIQGGTMSMPRLTAEA